MSTDWTEGLSDDELSRVVLKAMWPIPQLIVTGVIPIRQDEIDRARRRCGELRQWLGREYILERVRAAYLHWIEFCEGSIVEAEDELLTGKKRREFQDGQQRLREEQQRATALAVNLPKPIR